MEPNAGSRHSTSWRDPGALLLVSCYELGHPPQALALPLAFLERAGYRPAALDLSVQDFDPRRCAAARFVGISVPMHTALRLGIELARRVRATNPQAHICMYGLYAPLHEASLVGLADTFLGGECEAALVDLVEKLESGAAPTDRRLVQLQKLDFPPPSRATLPPLARYARLEDDGRARLAGYTETTRGCLHRCRHCPIPAVYEGRIYALPVPVVLEDVRGQVALGATHITFGDPDFMNAPTQASRVAHAVHAEFPTLTFDFTSKVEHLLRYPDLLHLLPRLGAIFAVTAVESLSDVVLDHLDKGHTRADVFAALRLCREAGIALRPSLLPFTPWSTLADYFDLLDWIEDEDLVDHVDPVQLSIRLLVPPGSLLLSSAAMQPHLGPLDEQALTYSWTHADPRMDLLQHQAAHVVEHAATHREPAEITFRRLRDLANTLMQDRSATKPTASSVRSDLSRRRAPRLTEPWFC